MKKIFCLFMLILFVFSMSDSVFAEGDPNVDNGGGGMSSGTLQNFWNPRNEGVRCTIINAETGAACSSSIDYTNKSISNPYHFGKKSKIDYKNGSSLSANGVGYTFLNPEQPLPPIISDGESIFPSIDSIKSYFTDEGVIRRIASDTGINFDNLTSGNYKLLIEPIAYFTYNGVFMAMTATEAALLDAQSGGDLMNKMAPLTHKNLPLAMFLEKNDLNFSAWNGSTTARATNSDIINYLGMGLVSFKEPENDDETEIEIIDYTYRTDTDVITSVTVSSSAEHNPDNPITVKFEILEQVYSVGNVIFPEDSSQLVWVKWHTPDTPQTVEITVSVLGDPSRAGSADLSDATIVANIVDLKEKVPPDPKSTDTKPNNWHIENIPTKNVQNSASWSVWKAFWIPNWQWVSNWQYHSTGSYVEIDGEWVYAITGGYWQDHGNWFDLGWYEFYQDYYSASISGNLEILPDEKSPTAAHKTMKSGYGFTQNLTASVSSNATGSAYTAPQNSINYFQEFYYKGYWRISERTISGNSAVFEFKENPFSTYASRVHFTPLWFPDGEYMAFSHVIDAWTPSGMLSITETDSLNISGNVYDDWHIATG